MGVRWSTWPPVELVVAGQALPPGRNHTFGRPFQDEEPATRP
jgi:hypothetical protein